MRPIKLVVEGFTSFRERQTLDFTNLDLFAIIGSTGSGKTSLLDAMTFALYDEVARDIKAKDLVSQGKETLKVEFQFRVGSTDYRIFRSWRYRRAQPEIQFILERFEEQNWKLLNPEKKDASRILGMDFTTFIRVVLLPQGKFAEFLTGEAKDRRKILSQLIPNFEIFEDMRGKAVGEAERFKWLLQGIETQLDKLCVPTTEEVEQEQEQLQELEQEIERLNFVIEEAQKDTFAKEQLLGNLKRLSTLQNDLSLLINRSSEFQIIRDKLEQAKAVNELRTKWEVVKEARKQYEIVINDVQEATEFHDEISENYGQNNDRLNRVLAREPQINTYETAVSSAAIYETQRLQASGEVSNAETNQARREANLGKVKEDLNFAQAESDKVQKQIEAIDLKIQRCDSEGTADRLNILRQVIGLLTTQDSLKSEVGVAQSNLDVIRSKTVSAQQTVQQITLALGQAEASVQKAYQTLLHAIINNAVGALRQSLHQGDTCPVCQGLCSSTGLLTDILTIDLKLLKVAVLKAQKIQQQQQQKLTKAKIILALIQQRQATWERELETRQTKLCVVDDEIKAILQTDSWLADSLMQEYQTFLLKDGAYQELVSNREKAKKDLVTKQQAVQLCMQLHAVAIEEWEQVTTELENRQKKLQEVEEQLDSVLYPLYEVMGKQSYQTLKDYVEGQRKEFETDKDEALKDVNDAEEDLIKVQERIRKAKEDEQKSLASKNSKEQGWDIKLKSKKLTEEEFLLAQVSPEEQEVWESELNDYEQKKADLESRINEVKALIDNKKTSEEEIVQAYQAIEIDTASKKEATEKSQKLRTWLEQVEQDRLEVEELKKQKKLYEEQRSLHHTLAHNLKNNEFQDYILESFQEELTLQASTFLKSLTQRYSLSIERGKYMVKDSWNGDEVRILKTLSGGEIFLSSLAMGLALSEKMSGGTEIGSLFLDEGFGTLDNEALEDVAEALESLRGQNRLVGIITHVEDLADRIQKQVRVIKSPDGSNLEVTSL